jgi:threonine dehydrogenase-like Zn-dependent dehydrogenase
MMTFSKTVWGVTTALAVSAPALAHHEATFTATSQAPPGPSAIVIGAGMIGLATLTVWAIKFIRGRT